MTVSSLAHRRGVIHFDDLNSDRRYDPADAYAQSKLANLLFTYQLHARLQAAGARTIALAAHPGNARTGLWRTSSRLERALLSPRLRLLNAWLAQSAQMGALPTLRAAVDPSARGGDYYGPGGRSEYTGHPTRVASSARSHDPVAQRRLWEVSEQLTGVSYRLLAPPAVGEPSAPPAGVPGKGGRYHHGDLKAALIEIAVELIGERGVRDFSLAEASRRRGVAVSAPYAHFADRDQLLAAVAVHAYERFSAALLPEMDQFRAPADRLAAMARAYVRFAAAHRPLFDALRGLGSTSSATPKSRLPNGRSATPSWPASVPCPAARPPPRSWPPPWKPLPTATPCCCLAGASARETRPLRVPLSAPPAPPSPWSKAAAC